MVQGFIFKAGTDNNRRRPMRRVDVWDLILFREFIVLKFFASIRNANVICIGIRKTIDHKFFILRIKRKAVM